MTRVQEGQSCSLWRVRWDTSSGLVVNLETDALGAVKEPGGQLGTRAGPPGFRPWQLSDGEPEGPECRPGHPPGHFSPHTCRHQGPGTLQGMREP